MSLWITTPPFNLSLRIFNPFVSHGLQKLLHASQDGWGMFIRDEQAPPVSVRMTQPPLQANPSREGAVPEAQLTVHVLMGV